MTHPFARDNEVNEPGIIGARWWNGAVHEASGATGRRTALGCITASIIGVAALTVIPVIAVVAGDCGGDDEKEEARASLKLQQDFGWNFDVPTQTVTFPPVRQQLVRAALATLVEDLTPKRTDLAPFAVHTLFQSPEALPKIKLEDGSNANIKPIAEALQPIRTYTMEGAFDRAKALLKDLSASSKPVALIVDTDGLDAVAFASAAAATHDPVFLFDNWPHPNGVVKAHLTLAAAVFYQPDLVAAKKSRPANAPPVFVLDRARLAPYTDSPTAFDNRYAGRLPTAEQLVKALGMTRILYVTDTTSGPVVLPDVSNTLSTYAAAGAEVRALMLNAFTNGGIYGQVSKPKAFLAHYGWTDETVDLGIPPQSNFPAHAWRPAPAAPATPDPSLTTLGVTTVAVALGTGYVLRRSGTWNRASSWGGG